MPRRNAAEKKPTSESGSGAGAGAPVSQKALQEKLLSSVYHMYTNPAQVKPDWGPVGLEQINQQIGGSAIHPRRKIVVMIIGNHSSSKSSFCNFYAGEEIQRTGVSVETLGFTVVTSGKNANEFKGHAALRLTPHVEAAVSNLGPESKQAFTNNFSVVVSTSKDKHFPLIDFIDTPGLVDGNTEYPFDVNASIAQTAAVADLILVFLDPIGKALCTRTMNVVEDLNSRGYHGKMRYYLTKADSVDTLSDLQKVIVQITQNLTSRVPAAHGFNVPTMWLPRPDAPKPSIPADSNELGKLCNELVKTIQQKVQSNMTVLEKDAEATVARLDTVLAEEAKKRTVKARWNMYRWCIFPMFPLLIILSFLDLLVSYHDKLFASLRDSELMTALLANQHVFDAVNYVPDMFGVDEPLERLALWVSVFFIFMVFFQFFSCRSRGLKTITADKVKDFEHYRKIVKEMEQVGHDLHDEYARSSQADEYNF